MAETPNITDVNADIIVPSTDSPDNPGSSDSSILPTLSTILFVLVALVVLVILVYYFWYVDRTDLSGEDLPNDLYNDDDTIISVFEKVKDRYGSYTAMKYRDNKDDKSTPYQTISYTNYWINTEAFSQRLLYFIGPHPRVAILSFNRPEWFYVHMGTMMSNGVSVGIYPTAMFDNCEYIINHSCVDLVIVENLKQLQKLEGSKIDTVRLILILDNLGESKKVTSVTDSIKKSNPHLDIMTYDSFMNNSIFNASANMSTEIEVSKPHPEDVATIIYTSGTTGKPKGVVQTHYAIMSAIKNSLYAIRSRSNIDILIGERYVSYLPLNHIAAQMMDIYVPICSIGSVTFADSDALKGSLVDTIKEIKPTIFIGVPRVWEKIEEGMRAELNKEGLASTIKRICSSNKMIKMNIGLDQTKYCIAAAAPLSESTRQFFEDIGLELCNVYGMSETCGPISMGVPGSSKGSGVPVIDLKIDKDTSEIMVRGPSLFKNYYKDKKATKDSFGKRRWFKTGDTGYIDRSGYLYVTGRIKDLIITAGGENISPIPIEEAIIAELKYRDLMKLVDHVVVVGNCRKFISVLIFTTDQGTKKSKTLEEALPSVISKANKSALNSTAAVKKHLILDTKLKVGETLTPTLKVRRTQIDSVFKPDIDRLYK